MRVAHFFGWARAKLGRGLGSPRETLEMRSEQSHHRLREGPTQPRWTAWDASGTAATGVLGSLGRDWRPPQACWAALDAIGSRHRRAGRLWTRLAAATGVLGGFGRDWQPPQACWTTLDTIGSRQRALGAARARGAPHSVAGSSGVLSAVWPGRRRDGRTRAASSVSLAKMNNPSNTFAMPVNVRS